LRGQNLAGIQRSRSPCLIYIEFMIMMKMRVMMIQNFNRAHNIKLNIRMSERKKYLLLSSFKYGAGYFVALPTRERRCRASAG
jgi:hypothetical protein